MSTRPNCRVPKAVPHERGGHGTALEYPQSASVLTSALSRCSKGVASKPNGGKQHGDGEYESDRHCLSPFAAPRRHRGRNDEPGLRPRRLIKRGSGARKATICRAREKSSGGAGALHELS